MAARPQRKQKETKNLEWNSTAKKLGMLKTSFMQRVGGSEGKLVPPEFTELATKVKNLKALLIELVDRVKKVNHAIIGYSQVSTAFGTTLAEFAAFLPSDDVLAPALLKFQEVQNDIETHRTAYVRNVEMDNRVLSEAQEPKNGVIFKEVLLASMSTAVEKFDQEEIVAFKELKKMWSKARLEYDAAKAKLDETLKTKQQGEPEALRYLRAHLHYVQARKREALRFEAALDKVGDVLWKRDFLLLQDTVVAMQALAKFLDSSYQTLAQLEEYLGQLKEHSSQRRAEWVAFKAQKKDERAKRLLEEHAVRYTPLVELLSNEDLALVNAVCVTAGAEQDTVLESLIHILDAHKMTLPIIKLGITREVEKTKSAQTLFRGNTMATKLMTAFTRMTGRQYLSNTLKPLLEELSANLASGISFEIDPEKAGDAHVGNMEHLKKASQHFLDHIVASMKVCPVPFRIMAAHLRDEVVRAYPEAKYISVGGFIFLRFFCPAILSPDSMTPPLLPTVDASVRRALILLSKSLQNLANGIEFGVKEPYMVPMNSFITGNDAKVKQFFDDLATAPSNEEYEPLCSVENAVARELPNLHTKIVQNLSKIGTSLTQYKQEDTIPALCLILAELTEEGLNIPVVDKKNKDKKDKK